MPSVASEAHAVPAVPSPPATRPQPCRRRGAGASRRHFAELLDSASPAAEPAPAPSARRDRSAPSAPMTASRRLTALPKQSHPPRTAPMPRDRRPPKRNRGRATEGCDGRERRQGRSAEADKPVKIAADPEQPATDATGEPKFDADTTAALDATVSDAEPPVTPLPPAPHVAAVVHVAASPDPWPRAMLWPARSRRACRHRAGDRTEGGVHGDAARHSSAGRRRWRR